MNQLAENDMESYRLERTGAAPVVFDGQEVARGASGPRVEGQDMTRWHEIVIYRTQGKSWVAAVQYHTQWTNETEKSSIEVAKTPGALAVWLAKYDPLADATGLSYLTKVSGEAKTAKIASSLKDRWAAIVGQVIGAIGVEERID